MTTKVKYEMIKCIDLWTDQDCGFLDFWKNQDFECLDLQADQDFGFIEMKHAIIEIEHIKNVRYAMF